MAFVENHDVIGYALRAHHIEEEMIKSTDGKYLKDGKVKEQAIHDIKKKSILDDRVENLVKHDHCLFEKRCFSDEYEFSFEDLLDPDEEYNGGLLFNMFKLNPYDAYGFENIAKYNDYFRVTKLSVHFASNADSNFAPIILKYIPPNVDKEITPQICLQATKTATSKDGAYMSLIMPDCMIRMVGNENGLGRRSEESKETVLPYLSDSLLCLNVDGYKYDYGTFVFYTRNPNQRVTFTLFWEIDYYSGVNYINIKESGKIGDKIQVAKIGSTFRHSGYGMEYSEESITGKSESSVSTGSGVSKLRRKGN